MDGTYSGDAHTVAGPSASGALAGWHIQGSGDFDGNGTDDIIWQADNGQVAMWLMDGTTPSFVGGVGPFNPGADWQIKGVGAFDGDGKSDLVFQSQSSGQVAMWMMDGRDTTFVGAVGPFNP